VGLNQPPDPQPSAQPTTIPTPIVWNQFRGEHQLFGYNPAFEPNPVGFAWNGRPLIRDRALNLQVLLDNGNWQRISLFEAAKESLRRQGFQTASWGPMTPNFDLFESGPVADERVVFDDMCNAYTILNANNSTLGNAFLLHSADGGHSWAAHLVPNTNALNVKMEVPAYGHLLHAPPALIINEKYDPGSTSSIAHHAWLVLPEKQANGSLALAGPYLISDKTLCCGNHSGFENQAVSFQDHVHIAYPGDTGVTDPITQHTGTPQYVVTFSRSAKQFINTPQLLGVGLVGPANSPWTTQRSQPDEHNQIALALDAQGYIHAVLAGHQSRMIYRKSTNPDNTSSWTAPEIFTLQPASSSSADLVDQYTYPSLVVDPAGQPNVVARWAGSGYVFRLVYMVKSAATHTWKAQQVLLDPGRPYYGVWNHKLSVDPWARLFISYSYRPGNLFSDEFDAFAKQYGFTLSPNPKTCVPTPSTSASPSYCEPYGLEAVNPSILISRPYHEAFGLATTEAFFEF
jgi:hypothetical protein